MPPRLPTSSDFPNITFTSTPPPPTTPHLSNILLLLHGLGDSHAPYTSLGKQLNLPETAVLSIRAPNPLPFDIGGFHWGDDVIFDAGGGLDPDAGFKKAAEVLREVVAGLIEKCGWKEREILLWGVGQGGMVAFLAGLQVVAGEGEGEGGAAVKGSGSGKGSAGYSSKALPELGGIVSLGGPLPSGMALGSGAKKLRTPVLVCGGTVESQVPDEKIQRVESCFEFVEKARWRRKRDGMPRSRDEMLPIMKFLARRLRSKAGVPEGSVEAG
ncbi:MAG: hypothetical protein MMC23_008586 [Stictis urceolatum]|nr:hypothetical protein [Stictis urceolata]